MRSTSPPPLLPRSTADPPPLLPPRPRRQTEHCSSSGQRVKTTKSTQWKKAHDMLQGARRLRRKPLRSRRPRHKQGGAATTNPQKNSLTVIPLKPLYQRDGPSQGET